VTTTVQELGAAVRDARRQQGLDQLLLADLAGVSDRFIRDLEHGKPTVRLQEVLRVLEALGLTLQVQPR
jgi:HTH-type transcriptional regulator / antitoxin HipB